MTFYLRGRNLGGIGGIGGNLIWRILTKSAEYAKIYDKLRQRKKK